MKKLLLGIVFTLVSTITFGQTANDYIEVQRGVLKTEKKASIAEVMQLTDQESAPFWALYNEYNEKMYEVNTELFNVIKDYADNYDKMSDDKAIELWQEATKVEKELAKLEKSYFKKFSKILPGKKAVRYMQAENKIKALVDAELALQIPMFQ